jgi:hypothetical protein
MGYWKALGLGVVFVLFGTASVARDAELSDWHPQAEELCLKTVGSETKTSQQTRLRQAIDRLSLPYVESNPFLELAQTEQTAICIEDRDILERGFYDPERNLIALSSRLDQDQIVVILAHELRHLDQYARGFCPSPQFDIKEEVRFTFIVEADAMAVTANEIWKLKQAEDSAPWEAFSQIENYQDIARSYAGVMQEGGPTEKALSAAFTQWFASDWRVDAYALSTCLAYYDTLDRTHLLQSYDLRSDELLLQVCVLPDGRRYPCNLPGR